MIKVKHARTADCVVAGFRWHKNGPGTMVGSLLLGLYDDDGTLHHVGVTAAFTTAMRKQLVEELAPLRENALEDHPWRDWAEAQEEAGAKGQRLPGATSRWNRGKDLRWEPLRPERVCEVAYDHMQGTRFRHAAHFVRWRPDKPPAGLPLRSARGHARLRAGPRFRRARPSSAVRTPRARDRSPGRADLLAGARASGTWRRLTGCESSGGAAAHRVDEDVVHAAAAPPPPDGAPSSARGRRARPPCARALATVMSGCGGLDGRAGGVQCCGARRPSAR